MILKSLLRFIHPHLLSISLTHSLTHSLTFSVSLSLHKYFFFFIYFLIYSIIFVSFFQYFSAGDRCMYEAGRTLEMILQCGPSSPPSGDLIRRLVDQLCGVSTCVRCCSTCYHHITSHHISLKYNLKTRTMV